MARLQEIVEYLDRELKTSQIKDYPGALNGLQLENGGEVQRIFSAVDASIAVIEEAIDHGGGLLLVHHGLFWQGAQPLTGPFYRKIRAAMDGNLAIYSSHLPLDMHPDFGNNILLAKAIGLETLKPVLEKDGWAQGFEGTWNGTMEELVGAVKSAVSREVHVCWAGVERPGRVVVITGGGGSQIPKIAKMGADAFITGEGPHWSFIEAEEQGINVVYAGHYATETFGVDYLGRTVARDRDLPYHFIQRLGGL